MDESTLGCAQDYAVRVYRVDGRDTGGPVELTDDVILTRASGLASVDWGRRLAETSEATIKLDLRSASAECCDALLPVTPWRFGGRLYRDKTPVWEGPLLAKEEHSEGQLTLEFSDVSAWLASLANLQTMSYNNLDVENIAYTVVKYGLDDADYSVPVDYPLMAQYMVKVDSTTLVDYRPGLVAEYVADTFADLREYGLDWTTLGRSLILSRRASAKSAPVARLTTDCFDGGLSVRTEGADVATYGWAVKSGSDDAPPTMVGYGSTGSVYGRHDRIVTVSDSEATTATMRKVARQAISGKTKPVVNIEMPTSTRLTSATPVALSDLICGRRFDVFFQGRCTRVRQAAVLEKVDVSWVPGDEQVKAGFGALGDATGIDPRALAAGSAS